MKLYSAGGSSMFIVAAADVSNPARHPLPDAIKSVTFSVATVQRFDVGSGEQSNPKARRLT